MSETGPTNADSSTPDTSRRQQNVSRRTPKSSESGGRGGGQRGRHNQGGYYGNSPQGMPHQRQFQQQRSSAGPFQSIEAQSSMPVGTKLQGHVESVKSKFGFIRVPIASEPIFFHLSELKIDGKHLSNGSSSASQAAHEDSSGTASHTEEQPVSEVLHNHSAPPGLHPAVGGQTGQQSSKDGRELTELVQPGQAVEFVVSASSHDKVKNKGGRAPKYIARQVCLLPEGSIAVPESSEKPIQGRIEKPLAGSSNQSWTNREEIAQAGGLISFQKQGTESEERQHLFVPFTNADLKSRGLRFNRGDPVEFTLSTDPKTGRQTASQVSPVRQARGGPESSGPREHGFVAKFQDTYGFIRSIDRKLHQQLFFHVSEVQLEPGQAVAAGAEVSFVTVPDTQGKGEGNPLAVRVQLLPEGTLQPEQRLEQVKGLVTRPWTGKEKNEPGRMTYEDEHGSHMCNFSLDQVLDGEEVGRALDSGDQVECCAVVLNRKAGTALAEGIKLLCKAEDKRELGQVKMLNAKGSDSWGFIRACDRPGDVFFHASQLKGVAMSELKPGYDLEFSVGRDPTPDQPKRIVATRITRAPKGSAAFDVISEQQHRGVVIDRMQNNKGNISSGLLHYEDSGIPAKLTFGPKDLLEPKVNPKAQDHVAFRTCINPRATKAAEKVGGVAAQYAGRRATQVELQVHAGKVQYVGRSHGFLEWQIDGEAQPRIMFNAFDVEGNLALCVGDEVTFTVADKLPRKDAEKAGLTEIPITARRIIRTKEATAKEEAPTPADRNPAAVKYTGSLGQAPGAPKGVRMARGPDGSKGFAPGRGRALQPTPASSTLAEAPGSVPGLMTTLSSGSLNPTAAEFVPSGMLPVPSVPSGEAAAPAAKIATADEELRSPEAASSAPAAKPPKPSSRAPQQDYRTLEAKKRPVKEDETEQHSTAEGANFSVGAETDAAPASKQQQQPPPAVGSPGRHAQQDNIDTASAEEKSPLGYTEEGSSAAGQPMSSEAEQKAGTDAPAAAASGPSKESAPAADYSQAREPAGAGAAALPEAASGAEVLEGRGPQQTEDAAAEAASPQTGEASEAGAVAALEPSKGAQASFLTTELAEEAAARAKGTTEYTEPPVAANGSKVEAPATDTGEELPLPVSAATAMSAKAGAEV